MELRSLRYFVYIAEARSFSQAAVHLRIAQPALSRQVSKMEAELGVQLFVRTGRRLELTDAGRRLLVRAHSLLRQASATVEEVRTYGSGLSGTIAVGVSPATCEAVAPVLLRECAARYPQMKLRFVEGFSSLVLDQLLNQELNLCILHNPSEHKALDITPLEPESMYLVGPPKDSEGLPPVDEETQLEALPIILPRAPHGLRFALEQSRLGRQLNVALEVDGLITTKALIEAGGGYTILPYSAIFRQVRAGQLTAQRLQNIEIAWRMCLVSHVETQATRSVQVLAEIVKNGIRKMVDSSQTFSTG